MQGSGGLPTPSPRALGDFGVRLGGAYSWSWFSPAFQVTGQFLTRVHWHSGSGMQALEWLRICSQIFCCPQGKTCLLITLPVHFIYWNKLLNAFNNFSGIRNKSMHFGVGDFERRRVCHPKYFSVWKIRCFSFLFKRIEIKGRKICIFKIRREGLMKQNFSLFSFWGGN